MRRFLHVFALCCLAFCCFGLASCGSDSVQWSSSTSNDGFDTQGGGTLGVDVRKYEGVAPQYENGW